MWKASFEVGPSSGFVLRSERIVVESPELKGIWLRRPKGFRIDPAVIDREVREFCVQEVRDLFLGMVAHCPNVMNPLGAETSANRKPHQLFCAQQVGLRVPQTLISNDAGEIEAFYERCAGQLVFKTMSGTQFQFTETRRFEREHLSLLGSAAYAPTMFQELVPPRSHLRVTAVRDQLFVVELRTSNPAAALDWRLDGTYCDSLQPRELPAELTTKILALRSMLGLHYAAMDFIERDDGEIFFLESNPGGQFLFAEIHGNVPISTAVARSLITPWDHTSS